MRWIFQEQVMSNQLQRNHGREVSACHRGTEKTVMWNPQMMEMQYVANATRESLNYLIIMITSSGLTVIRVVNGTIPSVYMERMEQLGVYFVRIVCPDYISFIYP